MKAIFIFASIFSASFVNLILWETGVRGLWNFGGPSDLDLSVSADSVTQLVPIESSPRALIVVVPFGAASIIITIETAVMNAVVVRISSALCARVPNMLLWPVELSKLAFLRKQLLFLGALCSHEAEGHQCFERCHNIGNN